uniref:SAP domain-containing protein n=1 Tax=Glossina austeni TaxID=7395 RepID=A0A1A9USF5_GLOAU
MNHPTKIFSSVAHFKNHYYWHHVLRMDLCAVALMVLIIPTYKIRRSNSGQLKQELRERNITATGDKRNEMEKLQRRLLEQLEKEGEDPSVFEFYSDFYEVSPTGSIVDGDDACTPDERREALYATNATTNATESKITGTTEKIEKIQENQDILKTRLHEVYQQIDGQINALEGRVDNALSQFDATVNVLEEKVTKVISQFDAKLETLEEKMGGTLSYFATLRSEVDAVKETAAKHQHGVGDSASKFQAPIIDDASNKLCEKCPMRQNKNKRPKATARKCHNGDKVGHIACKCKFWRNDSRLRLPTNGKTGLQHKLHMKGDKSRKLPDDCCRQKYIEKTVMTPECRKDRERRMSEEQNAKQNIVVRRIKVETNVKFSKGDVRNAQLADDDLTVIIGAKKDERVNSEQIDKESPIA